MVLGVGCPGGFGCFGALGKVYLAAEDGIVFDRKPQRAHIPFDRTTGPQLDTTAGNDIAMDLALNQNVPGREVRGNVCAWADGESALGQSYGSFDTPVDDQVFRAFNFPTNDDGLADPSRTIFGCHESIPFQNYFDFDLRRKMARIVLETLAIRYPAAQKACCPGAWLVA